MTNSELKSHVITLGNKLALRMGGDRKAAFVEAGAVEVKATGTSFGCRPEALARLASYSPAQVRAFIVPEPENLADPAALKIMARVQGGRSLYCMGYREAVPVVIALRTLPAFFTLEVEDVYRHTSGAHRASSAMAAATLRMNPSSKVAARAMAWGNTVAIPERATPWRHSFHQL